MLSSVLSHRLRHVKFVGCCVIAQQHRGCLESFIVIYISLLTQQTSSNAPLQGAAVDCTDGLMCKFHGDNCNSFAEMLQQLQTL